jgi:general secretion pathway protein D
MKKIVSLLFAICLVSCSQPKPQPQSHANYTPLDLSAEPTVAPQAEAAAPATSTTTTVTQSETHPTTAPSANTTTVTRETTTTTAPPVVPSTSETPSAQAVMQGVALAPGTTATNLFSRPPQPVVPAIGAPAPGAPGTAATVTTTNEPLIPELSLNFHAQPIEGVLQTYADFVHKTLLRSPSIPTTTTINLVQQNPLTRTELIHALDVVLAMNNIAMVPIGDKFIKVVPLSEAPASAPKINEDPSVLPEFGPFEIQIVQLLYTKPSVMVPILQQFTKTPAAVMPIEDNNILVLRDTAENVHRMLEMIHRIDVNVPSEIVSEVIPIKYALAADIADALNGLSGGGSGGTFGRNSAGHTGSLGTSRSVGPGSARGINSGYQPGGLNPQAGINGAGGTALGAAANAAASPSFTDRVKSLISSAGGKGEFQILGQTKIIADVRMNALLIFASRQDMEMIKDVVNKLDVVLAQVLIEAIIMEVTLDNTRTLGVSAAQQPIGGANHAFLGGYNNGQQFFPFTPGQQSGSNGFPGSFTSVLNPNMFSYWGKFGNFDVALQAAQNDSRVNVLSRPRIQTSHGVQANLFVGSTIPYVDSTTAGAYGGTGVYNSYQQQQVGITLKVTPLINQDGLVVMDIYQEASVQGPPGTAVTINGSPVPIINQRQASATVAVKDHDTIILGGMISTSQTKTKSGVPYLKDIPLLGNLFRSNANTEERVELVVLLRPTVLPTPEAAAAVANVERLKLPGVRRAEAEIHAEEAERLKQAEQVLNQSHTNGATIPVNDY